MERDGIVADAVHTLQQYGMYSSCGPLENCRIAIVIDYTVRVVSQLARESKNTRKKSPIHENADTNITCDFGASDISRLGVAYLTHIERSLPRLY